MRNWRSIHRTLLAVLFLVQFTSSASDTMAAKSPPSTDVLLHNYQQVAALELDFLLPWVFADDERRDEFSSMPPGDTLRIEPVARGIALGDSASTHPLIWVWMDGHDLVAAFDENGDATREDARPDSIEDCYVVDLDADGTVDRVVDWDDVDRDGRVDRQVLYKFAGKNARGSAPMTCAVVDQRDLSPRFWHLERWDYSQPTCQFLSDFNGNHFFTWGRYQIKQGRWESYSENPYGFYDLDRDGISEESLQISGSGERISTIRWSFDTDGDAGSRSDYDYDLSVTAVQTRRVPGEFIDTLMIRGGPLTLTSWSKARDWIVGERWESAVLVVDEVDRNTNPADPEARERWEGIIPEPPPKFPRLGDPNCGRLNKRYEYYWHAKQNLRLYLSSVDGRLHLFGATIGELIVDRDLDGEADAVLRTEDRDQDGYFDHWLWDNDNDGTFDSTAVYLDHPTMTVPMDIRAIRAAEREIARSYKGASQADRFAEDVARWSDAAAFVPRSPSLSDWSNGQKEESYRRSFIREFPKIATPMSMEEYVSVGRFDSLYMSPGICPDSLALTNEDGSLAWRFSRAMMSLNEMYQATGESKYLQANLKCARWVLAARDDARGVSLSNGCVAPVWGSSRYIANSRSAHIVHTGYIAIPILDLLRLARDISPPLIDSTETGAIASSIGESLDYHRKWWRFAADDREGYYLEDDLRDPNPQPANALSVIGAALWLSWDVSGNEEHRDKALALARFIRNRLEVRLDGGYSWPHILRKKTPKELSYISGMPADDTSHGGITLALPLLMARTGIVFDTSDIRRFGWTAIRGFARSDDGILYANVPGSPEGNPGFIGTAAIWLGLCPETPELYGRIARFYLERIPIPDPLDLALLIRYADCNAQVEE
ncbi:MAG: hypothetical protein KJ970_13590 [Candidatus Eisenbacteria bacterium]|uniref:Uncharacterized protein n=1 Tax=Eiseniibacteriota bacterium TaxID=2212470 RepID=A0A948RZC7_UNCEI|nr:hypothetical protein [Candidatus Eisenbacteria bacterium]MBU1947610.1 hypothetical protein [Candidatus Eisenbacteria bacterium]MBU2691947.1 hypothetical protein [Candidatus Eisenbacteria bacterium]